MKNLTLYDKLETLPENLKAEVSGFIDFLLSKSSKESNQIIKPNFGSAKGLFKINAGFEDSKQDFEEYI